MDINFTMSPYSDIPLGIRIKDKYGAEHLYRLDDRQGVTVDALSLSTGRDFYIMRCPNCGATVAQHTDYDECSGRVPEYCPECGQHLERD